ncbi:MAG TPA: hypothetical protein VKV30_05140 [Candidatus Angelobacter sp.]|nr:hypothetical protein [Candidatus Angelobacter sp.]
MSENQPESAFFALEMGWFEQADQFWTLCQTHLSTRHGRTMSAIFPALFQSSGDTDLFRFERYYRRRSTMAPTRQPLV